MALFNWDSSLSVNIAEIDEQHKKLVNLVNDLFEAMKEGKGSQILGKVLSDLTRYTKTHFATEERLMRSNSYPSYLVHKKEHDELIAQVDDLNKKFQDGQMVLSTSVGNFLKSWLVNHIKGTDMKYKPFLNQKGVV
ncbi:MAG: hemerythrin family protein [Desulfobulbaceae bacterium]|nr:hemerythrin family protein [Desulfobulbaceae bacterium]